MTILWHGEQAIGICLFVSPPRQLSMRKKFFGLSGKINRLQLQSLGKKLVILSRVVIHPVYRGGGLASRFIRRSCETSPWPWIEALAEMGHIHPFFESAGFQRIGVTPGIDDTKNRSASRLEHSAIYGGGGRNGRQGLVSRETHEKSRYARPVYYIFDNRRSSERLASQ